MSVVLPISEITGGAPCAFNDLPLSAHSPEARIAYLRESGIDAELLFPTIGLFLSQHPDRRYYDEFAWAYNRWLGEQWCGTRQFACMGMLGRHDDPAAWKKSIDFAVSHGMAGLLLPSEPTDDTWSSRTYASMFAAMAEASMIVGFHAFTRSPRSSISRSVAGLFAASHEAMDVLTEVVVGGVLARTPGLKVICGEGESWWVTEWRSRLTVRAEGMPRNPPLDDILSRIRVTDGAPAAAAGDLVLWASDFPHGIFSDTDGRTDEEDETELLPSVFDGSFWRRVAR